MALSDLSVENTIVVITGVGVLDDWGRTDPPFTLEYIDDVANLSRGLGGNAVRFHRKNPGLRLTVNFMPGSPQALALQAQVLRGPRCPARTPRSPALKAACSQRAW